MMSGLDSTHSLARASNSPAGTTSSITPAALAFTGSFSLPSSNKGEAAIAPNLRTNRVVPPAPGKIPTRISGRPILALGLSAAKIRWQASGISNPIPSAVPGRAAAIGLPPFSVLGSVPARSIRRKMACIPITPSNSPRAGSSPASSRILAMMFRSIPPAKLSLPLVMMMPLTATSASACPTSASISINPCAFRTFIDLPLTSQTMVATPSASVDMVKSVIWAGSWGSLRTKRGGHFWAGPTPGSINGRPSLWVKVLVPPLWVTRRSTSL